MIVISVPEVLGFCTWKQARGAVFPSLAWSSGREEEQREERDDSNLEEKDDIE